MEVLLSNRDRWAARGAAAAPLVVICYTNRALGEFCPYLLNPVLDRSGILRDCVHVLKTSPTRFFTFDFFRDGPSQAPYLVFKDFLNLALNSRRYFRYLVDSLLLFKVGNQYSLYCFIWRDVTLCIIIAGSRYYIVEIISMNSRLSFNTESRYSPYCLIQRVTTPCIFYSRESLLTEGSYVQ